MQVLSRILHIFIQTVISQISTPVTSHQGPSLRQPTTYNIPTSESTTLRTSVWYYATSDGSCDIADNVAEPSCHTQR